MDGGYDDGYTKCPCFWGSEPGSLVKEISLVHKNWSGKRILDVGCGEGKNAIFLASQGAYVEAYDVSDLAIEHAKRAASSGPHGSVTFEVRDAREIKANPETFDGVIAYGFFHCLASPEEIRRSCVNLKALVARGGGFVLCAFNDRSQDLSAHPGFFPTLLPHLSYLELFADWEIILSSDRDLHETHPHNGIPHVHSMTRILARRP